MAGRPLRSDPTLAVRSFLLRASGARVGADQQDWLGGTVTLDRSLVVAELWSSWTCLTIFGQDFTSFNIFGAVAG
jgi:hypothetical protein